MPITLDIRDRIAEIVFDHPPVNAFDTTRWELIPKLIAEAGNNEQINCVLIRAEGRRKRLGTSARSSPARAGPRSCSQNRRQEIRAWLEAHVPSDTLPSFVREQHHA